ncbi:MAG: hypothetical protein AVDCRST_MAG79-106, partial [uncultured Thermoleophilia bacterium]
PARRPPRAGGRRGDLAPVHAAPLPPRRDRPAARADPHLPGAALPERRPRHRPGRRHHRRGRLGRRRDHGRRARPEPDDGQLAARHLRLRPTRGPRGGRRSRRGGSL